MSLSNYSRKGQSALEFVILIGFALMMISVLLIVFQGNLERMNAERDEALINQMFNLVLSEISFAEISRPDYNRTFYLPINLGSQPYSLKLESKFEVVLDYAGEKRVMFLTNEPIVGTFISGRNVIFKNSSGIYLNP